MTASDSSNDPDPDRTIRYPEIQKVLDEHFNRWPTSDQDPKPGGGR